MDETSLGVSAALAPFLPFLISLLKRPGWPPVLSMALTAAAAFGVAVVGLLIDGQVDLDNGIQDVDGLLGAAGLVFAESQMVYRLIIKGTVTGERLNQTLTTFPAKPAEGAPSGEPGGVFPS